jgi:hypothetical protein
MHARAPGKKGAETRFDLRGDPASGQAALETIICETQSTVLLGIVQYVLLADPKG